MELDKLEQELREYENFGTPYMRAKHRGIAKKIRANITRYKQIMKFLVEHDASPELLVDFEAIASTAIHYRYTYI